jgi:two-component system nitrogen regulation sensor histidine kinase GlnL
MNDVRQILDSLATGIVVLDEGLRIRALNVAAENLLHTSEAKASGQPLSEFLIRSDRIIPSLRSALKNAQPYTEREVSLQLPDQLTEEVDFTVNLLEPPTGLVLELHSLNRLRRINQDDESVSRQETTRRLIRGLAHEVKNPLGGIRGAAQLLEKELPDEDLREYTGVIISEADRLSELVDRMLGSNREPKISNVSTLRIFERVVQLVEAEHPGFITWQRDYDPSLPEIEADEDQLIQAVLNIVRNAYQAMTDSTDAKITLRSRVVRQYTIGCTRHRLVAHLEIIDNGPGIERDLIDRIFFPMISGRADGSGLGLSITQTIIGAHHGSIQVDSRAGRTCFSIHIPFTQPDYHKEAS